ncbi:DUF4364 family protein [Scatolibacter rhodanostii]|uniref:DUF4364 family protein n=1 Tax=Scatolibacter rhodanostii TaxID=2014781 RepID=UPI000C08A1EC|nr:DUF4364 family protein [Scatolibacter rhodanostii]
MSPYDAFTAGVDPGGLRTKNDIRILICYILESVNAPLSGDDLAQILQEKSLANYFEIIDAINALIEKENIQADENGDYLICETGRKIADTLDTTLPLSVRDKALEAAVTTMARTRSEKENKVEIIREEKGFRVICHISGGDVDLMEISIYVPHEKQAKMVKSNFHSNPGKIYELILNALTGNL